MIEIVSGDNNFEACFFSDLSVFIPNPMGNPYGRAVRFLDHRDQHGLRLRTLLPIGEKFKLQSVSVYSNFFQRQALAIWPLSTEPPGEYPDSRLVMKRFEIYHESLSHNLKNLVRAEFHGLGARELDGSTACVWDIKNESYGILEVNLPRSVRFFALFHKEDVYLKDGKRAVEHDFFMDKPLSEMVSCVFLSNI